jgi:hypothetical protein
MGFLFCYTMFYVGPKFLNPEGTSNRLSYIIPALWRMFNPKRITMPLNDYMMILLCVRNPVITNRSVTDYMKECCTLTKHLQL